MDFGLYSLVGATIAFMAVFNSILNGSVARYYAYEIGAGKKGSSAFDVENLIKWFNTAFVLHAGLAILVLVFGYPLGYAAITKWLVIPPERLEACMIVFHLALASCIVSIIVAPYLAMFYATQNIVETSLWGILSVVCVCLSALAILRYDGDRMKLYSVLFVGSQVVVNMCMVVRSRIRFAACRLRLAELFDKGRIKSLLCFAGWQSYAAFGDMVRMQGTAFVINKCWGVGINASYAISNQVAGQTGSLSQALQNAISPAIIAKTGEGNESAVSGYVESANKISALLIAVFTVPLSMEMGYVLRLWLGFVPDYAGTLCICTLVMVFIDRLSGGSMMAVVASGKVGAYQCCAGTLAMISVLFIFGCHQCGFGPVTVGVVFIFLNALKTVFRLYFARRLMGFSASAWLRKVFLPIVFVCLCTLAVCGVVRIAIEESLLRVLLSSLASVAVIGILSWFVIFNVQEQALIRNICVSLVRKAR